MVAPGEVARRPVAEDPDEGRLERPVRADERHGVAHGVAGLLRRHRVERHLAGRGRTAPLLEPERRQVLVVVPVAAEGGGARRAEDLARRVHDGDAVDEDLAARLRHAVHGAHVGEQRGGKRGHRAGEPAALDVLLRRDDDVGGGAGEQVGERGVEGVGEDQRADDEADAQHDGHAGEDEAELVVQQAPPCAAQHGARTSGPCRRSPSSGRAPARPSDRPWCRRSARRRGTARGRRTTRPWGRA